MSSVTQRFIHYVRGHLTGRKAAGIGSAYHRPSIEVKMLAVKVYLDIFNDVVR
jgi:hypothetical protein